MLQTLSSWLQWHLCYLLYWLLFLKEYTDKKTWIAIFITFLSVAFIFYDSIQLGNLLGDIFGFITALGLAINANLARFAKKKI